MPWANYGDLTSSTLKQEGKEYFLGTSLPRRRLIREDCDLTPSYWCALFAKPNQKLESLSLWAVVFMMCPSAQSRVERSGEAVKDNSVSHPLSFLKRIQDDLQERIARKRKVQVSRQAVRTRERNGWHSTP